MTAPQFLDFERPRNRVRCLVARECGVTWSRLTRKYTPSWIYHWTVYHDVPGNTNLFNIRVTKMPKLDYDYSFTAREANARTVLASYQVVTDQVNPLFVAKRQHRLKGTPLQDVPIIGPCKMSRVSYIPGACVVQTIPVSGKWLAIGELYYSGLRELFANPLWNGYLDHTLDPYRPDLVMGEDFDALTAAHHVYGQKKLYVRWTVPLTKICSELGLPFQDDEGYIQHVDPLGLGTWNPEARWLRVARRNALREVFPRLGEGFNAVLFLKEFVEVRQMIAQLRGWALKLGNGFQGALTLAVAFIRGEVNLFDVAGQYLGIAFGLIPFICDVRAFFLTCATFRQRYYYLFSNEGRIVETRCQEVVHFDPGTNDTVRYVGVDPCWSYNYSTGWPLYGEDALFCFPESTFPNVEQLNEYRLPVVFHARPETAKYHLTLFYRYYLSLPQGWGAWFTGLLDAFGAAPQFGDVWQAIPLSFVVDWFTNASGHIDELVGYDAFDMTYEVVGGCESVKYDWTATLGKPMGGIVDFGNVECRIVPHTANQGRPFCRSRFYDRRVLQQLPDVPLQGLRLPRGMRWITLGALVRQRLPDYKPDSLHGPSKGPSTAFRKSLVRMFEKRGFRGSLALDIDVFDPRIISTKRSITAQSTDFPRISTRRRRPYRRPYRSRAYNNKWNEILRRLSRYFRARNRRNGRGPRV